MHKFGWLPLLYLRNFQKDSSNSWNEHTKCLLPYVIQENSAGCSKFHYFEEDNEWKRKEWKREVTFFCKLITLKMRMNNNENLFKGKLWVSLLPKETKEAYHFLH